MNNPFTSNFESFEGPISPLVETLHGAEFDQLKELITGDDGVLISLRAPRAGFGKTMLLSRLREEIQTVSWIVPVELSADLRIEEKNILGRILDQLTTVLSGKKNLSGLDFCMRRLLAHALISLVESGEVPSPNRTESLRSLRERPEEVFDFQNESAAVAQWVKAQFSALSPRLVSVIGQSCGGVTGDLSHWFSALSRYAMIPIEKRVRNRNLLQEVLGKGGLLQTGSGSHGALTSLLKLITATENVVLVVDEMDGLFGDSEAALRVANSLIAIRQAASRTKVIFSVNDDVWESAFARRIPLGMQDRFEDHVIRLKPLDEEGVMALLKVRHLGAAGELRQKIQLDGNSLYPRAVLWAARDVWVERVLLDERQSGSSGNPGTSSIKNKDIGFAEVPPEKLVETDLTESGKPDLPFAVPKVKIKYPPKPVQKVAIPRRYMVERIPQENASDRIAMNYPPNPVRRVGIPRKFSIQRIRQKSDSVRVALASPVTAEFKSPFKIADASKSAAPHRAKTSPPPLPDDKAERDSIDDLLRKFRERYEPKDLY